MIHSLRYVVCSFFFNDTATTEIYTYRHTLSLHDALPISGMLDRAEQAFESIQDTQFAVPAMRALIRIYESEHDWPRAIEAVKRLRALVDEPVRSEEHTSELQSLMRISYAVFCLKKKIHRTKYVFIQHNQLQRNNQH